MTQICSSKPRRDATSYWGFGLPDLLGKSGDDAESYAREVVKADFEEAGDEDVYRKLAGDLGDKVSEADIRAQMVAMMAEAKAMLVDEA